MVSKSKILLLTFFILSISACSYTAPFKPSSGFLVTAVKAPLSVEIPKNKIGKKKTESYDSSFFWIPLTALTVAATQPGTDPVEHYSDYEHFSVFGGLFQWITVATYE